MSAPAPEAAQDTAPRRPASCTDLFRTFSRLALQGFGGVLPVAHHALVERERWLNQQQFVELLTLSQVLPGPNIINMAVIFGDRHFGWRGALAASAGLLLAPMCIVLGLTVAYQQQAGHPAVAGALRGMGAVAAGLIVATAVKLMPTLRHNPLGVRVGAVLGLAAFALVGVLRWPMVWVVLSLGGLGMALAWRRLRAAQGPP